MNFCMHKVCEECFCKNFNCPDPNCNASMLFGKSNNFFEKILSSSNYQLYLQKPVEILKEKKIEEKCISCLKPLLNESECQICSGNLCQKCLNSKKCLACNYIDCKDCYKNHWNCNREIIEKAILKLKCPLCYDSFPLEAMLTFECNHRFCKKCVFDLSMHSINSNMKILCPEENCPNPEIDTHIVNAVLAKQPALIEKYDKFLLDLIMNEDQVKNEKIVYCQECKINFYVPVEAFTSVCNRCDNLICVQKNCGYEYYNQHKDKRCEDLREDSTMKALRNEGKVQRCPECFVYIDKIVSSCNYVRCSSIKCQKRTIFCFLCGEKLAEGDLKKHFLDGNEYAPCLSRRKKKDRFGKSIAFEEEKREVLEKKLILVDQFTFGEYNREKLREKFNSFSCPKCSEKKNLQFNEDFPIFFKCLNKNKCQGNYLVCMVCQNSFPGNDPKLHLEYERKIIFF